jgi:glyoxylase-like metal-dependent hydrolase (beta-lactamase superfamily II)
VTLPVDDLVRGQSTLGDFELTILTDGTYLLDGGAMFGVVPKPLWEKRTPANERNQILLGTNTVVVRTGKHTVVIETGIGNKLSEKQRSIFDNRQLLMESFRAAGIGTEEVDVVINTHLHFDHCGWNTIRNKDGKIVPTFPRAKYYAPEGEWQYARKPSERDAISYIPDNYDPLVQSGQMTLLKGGEEIVPGISVKTFPGHTASLQAVIVNGRPGKNSGAKGMTDKNMIGASEIGKGTTSVVPSAVSEKSGASAPAVACYISDLIPTTAHIDIAWGMGFDLYPLQTIESKKRYYAKAIPEKWLTVFTHDPRTPWAYVEKDDMGKMWARVIT